MPTKLISAPAFIYVVASKSSRNSLVNLQEFLPSGTVHYEFIPKGKIVSKEMYTDILHRLMDAVRRKCAEKWRTNSWFLLHDNAPAHRSALVKDFLAKNNMTTLEHPPYSPDQAVSDFYLFSWLKSALKGRRFCDATDILRMRLKIWNDFQKFFHHIYSRLRKCEFAQGEYFEGNVA